MPCSENSSHSAMCVPINVRFFDSTNTHPITQLVGGDSFVARVYVKPDNDVCSGTQIVLTHSAAAAPVPPGPIPNPGNLSSASISVPDPVDGQNPPNPLTQFHNAADGLYTYATMSTNPVLNATSVTIRGTNSSTGKSTANSITVVRTADDLIPLSETRWQNEEAIDRSQTESLPDLLSAMCVPINVRFFDSTNTQSITQIKGGQSFVARVGVPSDGANCQGTQINITYTVQVVPTSLDAIAIPVPLLTQVPANPLQQIFQDASGGLYLCAAVTPSTALNGTTLTVTATNPKQGPPKSSTINIVP